MGVFVVLFDTRNRKNKTKKIACLRIKKGFTMKLKRNFLCLVSQTQIKSFKMHSIQITK